MQVSVVLAVRNAERFLPALLASLERQTRLPAELVVCDDASDDTTPELLARFADRAPFAVRIERFDTWRGHVAGFMTGARLATGDAIAFCDGDDVWLDHKLEVCVRALDRPGTWLAMHTTRVVDAELADLGRCWPAIGETRLAPPLSLAGLELHAPGMAMLFRRELLDAADFDARPPSRYGEGPMLHDEWIFFLADVVGATQLIGEPLLLYRQHGANDSGGWIDHQRGATLRPALGNYRRAAEHTRGCAEYLEAAAPEDPVVAERLAAGARSYRRASANWTLRASLYQSADRRRRARVLRQLVSGRAYSDRTSGGFGRSALGKDLLAGVALGLPGTEEG